MKKAKRVFEIPESEFFLVQTAGVLCGSDRWNVYYGSNGESGEIEEENYYNGGSF